MYQKAKIPKKIARRIAIVEFFMSAKKPVHEQNVLTQFGISFRTLTVHDLPSLRKIGINIRSSMRYYSLHGKVDPDCVSKITGVKSKPAKKHTIKSKRNVIVDWAAVTAQFQEAMKSATRIKIGSRYKVETDFNESFTGKLVFLRDGVYGFDVSGDYKTARLGKCKLTVYNG